MADMNEQLDRFARGELSPAESRDLARKALADQDLFDELTATAIARRGLRERGTQRSSRLRIAILAAAAVVIVGVALYAPRRNSELAKRASGTTAPPVLLARSGDSNPENFRGADTGNREPRAMGSVGSIAGGIATLDLGSVDGLAKGVEVDVIREGQAIGHIQLTTVFLSHSRGEAVGGASIRVNDQVRVPPSGVLRAILDQIAASLARGESEKAMSLARHATVDSFDAELSSEEDLNNAGVIAEVHGNAIKALEFYHRAREASRSARGRLTIEKNLARLEGAK
jgi:hypothetical protein